MTKSAQKLLLLGTAAGYCLIGIEILIMISPFALYFYSVYGTFLDVLAASPLTSWTTEFFLPHMVFLDDPLILTLSYLQVLLVIGLLLFLGAAIPLYYGRFTGKKVVSRGFYAKIRHPQYLFLAISGFGLLLYWPRFIILVCYISMLYVYYLLARNEEWRMKIEAPGEYEAYLATTPMFIPGNPGGRVYALLFGRIRPRWLGMLCSYLVSMVVAVCLALGLRAYTVHRLPVVQQEPVSVVSVFPRPDEEVSQVVRAMLADPAVQEKLQTMPAVNLAYLMPGDFFLTALVTDEDRRFSDEMIERFPEILEWHQHKFRGGLAKFFKIFYNFIHTLAKRETDYDIERCIFVAVSDHRGIPEDRDHLFDLGVHRRPRLLVDMDHESHKVVRVIATSNRNKWGDMPMPVF